MLPSVQYAGLCPGPEVIEKAKPIIRWTGISAATSLSSAG